MFSLLPLMGLASAAWSQPQLMAEQPLSIMPVQVNALQTSQASDIITNPEGTDALYTMNCDIVTQWGNFTYPSLRSEICFDADGETIYFHNLFPRYQECWVKGTIVGGNDIVIASGQPILVDPEYGEVYFYASQQSAEEEGLYYTVDEMHLTVETVANGHTCIYSADPTVLGGVVKFDDEGAGYLVLGGLYDMEEFLDPFATLPEGVQTEQYILSYTDYYNHSENKTVEVGFDGQDVYLQGLVPDSDSEGAAWVKGSLEGDQVVIPSMQAARSGLYLLSFCAGYIAEYSEYGEPLFANQEALTLNLSADRKELTNVEGDYALTIYGNRQAMIYAFDRIRYRQYEGDQPAVPATPVINYADDWMVDFTIPTVDVEGNFINPEKITWSMFMDGDLFEFDPNEYVMLWEPMTELEWSFTDSYDILAYGDSHMVFLYDQPYTLVEIQSYYTVDGVRNASAKACWGETPVGLIPLEGDTQISSIEFYDLAGHRLPAATGTCICRTLLSNGKVVSKIVRN